MKTSQKQYAVAKSQSKVIQAQEAFVSLLNECSSTGYFGSVSLTLKVQDGHIQQVQIATDRQLR